MRILDETIYDGSGRCIYAVGTSSETKPTDNVISGSIYFEVDTSKAYMYNETSHTWVEARGTVDESAIEAAVSEWLEAHPEATTTVADGSITEPKLASALLTKINNSASGVTRLSDEIDTLDDRVTVLENGGTDGASPIINSASGAVASFADGSASPARSAVVTLAPVQDLHGYDYPWPGGGGDNLYDVSEHPLEIGAISSSEGTDTVIQTRVRTVGLIPIKPSTQYFVSATLTDSISGSYYPHFYGENGGYILTQSGWQNLGNGCTSPSNAAYMRFVMRYINDAIINVSDFTNVMLSADSAKPYSQYANICPISGHTGTNVQRTGKNLLNKAAGIPADIPRFIKFGVNQYSDIVPNKTIKLLAGTYTFSVSGANSTNYESFAIFDESNTRVVISYNAKGITFTLTETGFYYITLSVPADVFTSWDNYDLMLEFGSVATSYTPYTGQTYSATFPSEAGTVYGGTYDFVSGKLIVDRASVVVNGSESWEKPDNCFRCTSIFADSDYPVSVSSVYPVATSYAEVNGNNNRIAITQSWLRIHDERFSTVADFVAYLEGTNVQLVYKLATPIEYDLTPQQLNTLLGVNNAWSTNGANTAIEYKADTKLYIDGKIAELSALIASL